MVYMKMESIINRNITIYNTNSNGVHRQPSLFYAIVKILYIDMIFIDTIFGFLFTRYMAGERKGKRGRVPSLRFRAPGNYTIHLHHWFLCSFALVCMYRIDISSTFLYGLVYGSIAQGLTYRDFYKFIYKENNLLESRGESGQIL